MKAIYVCIAGLLFSLVCANPIDEPVVKPQDGNLYEGDLAGIVSLHGLKSKTKNEYFI